SHRLPGRVAGGRGGRLLRPRHLPRRHGRPGPGAAHRAAGRRAALRHRRGSGQRHAGAVRQRGPGPVARRRHPGGPLRTVAEAALPRCRRTAAHRADAHHHATRDLEDGVMNARRWTAVATATVVLVGLAACSSPSNGAVSRSLGALTDPTTTTAAPSTTTTTAPTPPCDPRQSFAPDSTLSMPTVAAIKTRGRLV